jgi:ribose transport system substrate-binding protein
MICDYRDLVRGSIRCVSMLALSGLLGTSLIAHAADTSKGKKILLLQPQSAHPYIATMTKTFREGGEALGMEITTLSASYDAALQSQQVDDGIARKFDLIAIGVVSEQAIIPALARAKQGSIPVILINGPVKPGNEDFYVTFVGQDHTEMGRIAGRSIVEAVKGSGRDAAKVALITGALTQGIGPRRLAGLNEVLATHPNIKVVATEDARWDTATSERIAGQLYARFAATGGLDVVYGMADNQAVAAIKAAGAAGIAVGKGPKQLIVVGGNCLKEGTDAIRADQLYSSVTQSPTEVGAAAIKAADDFFAGKKVPKDTLLPVEAVTKANVDKFQALCTY